MSERPILIVGATGTLGSRVAKLLAESGHAVRAVVRPTSSPERRQLLSSPNIQMVTADLKDPASLLKACEGTRALVSTATSLLSSDPSADSIETVDAAGQLSLVAAAEQQKVEQFVFLSFPESPIEYELQAAKRAVEARLRASQLLTTSARATNFMEVWFSPVLGFDIAARSIRIFGDGTRPIQWISLVDVARFIVREIEHPPARSREVALGGPDHLSYLDVAAIFQEVGAAPFQHALVSEEILEQQLVTAPNSLAQAFAAVALSTARGQVANPNAADELPGRLTSVREFARQVMNRREKEQ